MVLYVDAHYANRNTLVLAGVGIDIETVLLISPTAGDV